MYFWRIENLKNKMTTAPLSEREVLPYVIWSAVVTSASWTLPGGEKMDVGHVIMTMCNILIVIFGTIYVYRQNGGANGQHFLQRLYAIGWVITIRWCVYFIGALAVIDWSLMISTGKKLGSQMSVSNWYYIAFWAIFYLALFTRLAHHVRDVAQRAKPS